MSNHQFLQNWQQEQLLPWLAQSRAYRQQVGRQRQLVQQQVAGVKDMLVLLLEGKEAEVVKRWNSLGLKPALRSVQFDNQQERLIFVTENDTREVMLDELLEDIQTLIDGKQVGTNEPAREGGS